MNVLMILSKPFTNDPRVYNEAKSLVKAGHKVTVLARDRKKENLIREEKDGISIRRIFNTKFMSMLPYNFFDLYFWWNEGFKRALELYREFKFDIVHCHDLSTLPIGIKLKRKLEIPLIYDAHEIWGYMVSTGISWWRYYIWKEKHIIRNVDRIITVNEPLKNYFEKITDKPITIIMNCKPLQVMEYEPSKNNKFTLLYLGGFTKSRFLLEIVDVVKELPDIHCIIGGMGDPVYANALKDKCSNARNVDFIGRIPMSQVLPMTKKSDVVVCLFDPYNKNNQIALPNKVFEAMVCGRPIICTRDIYSGNFVKNEKCGLVSEYSKEGLRDAIIQLRDNPKFCEELGRNALNAAIREYNWKKQKGELVKIYEKL